MADVTVVGVGMIPFGKHPQRTLVDMGAEAAYLALKDAGLSPRQVEIGFFSNAFASRLFGVPCRHRLGRIGERQYDLLWTNLPR